MEFLPCEVYANELAPHSDTLEAESRDIAAATKKKDQNKQKACGGTSRSARVVQVDDLPQLQSKAAAFESFLVVVKSGIFGGRHDGIIYHWQLQPTTSFTPPAANVLNGHAGPVLTIDFTPELGKEGLLFTGSADRTIRVWDPWGGSEAQLHSRSAHYCVQIIDAHSSSVTCVKLLTSQNNGLVSCSLDRTIKTWYPSEGRGLLLYPWYLPAQSITLATGNCPTALCMRSGASSTLFVGDSKGCISVYTSDAVVAASDAPDDDHDRNVLVQDANTVRKQVPKNLFHLKRRHSHFHSLGVIRLQLVAENSLLVSLGFDRKAQIIDVISGALSSTIVNPNPARYTSCAWDSHGQLLFLCDSMGIIQVWNVVEDKLIKKTEIFSTVLPLLTVDVLSCYGSDFLVVGCARGAKQWQINRDIGYVECTGHSEAIVGITIINDDTTHTQSMTEDGEMMNSYYFFSASSDNSIRCWDSYDMRASYGFEELESELTCMILSKTFQKLFTGHENGTVKAWGIHTGQFYIGSQNKERSAITCLACGVVRDQEFLLAGDVDGRISIWEATMDRFSHVFTLTMPSSLSSEKHGEITAILFNRGCYLAPKGEEFFVTGCNKGNLCVWNFAKKTLIRSFKAHEETVTCLVMHGCFLFSGSEDTVLRIWNLINPVNAYELGVLHPPLSHSSSGSTSPIVSLDVIPRCGFIISASLDGTVIIWDYKSIDDETTFDAYGKIVHRTKLDHRIHCIRYWPQMKVVVCGSTEGKLLICDLPSHVQAPIS